MSSNPTFTAQASNIAAGKSVLSDRTKMLGVEPADLSNMTREERKVSVQLKLRVFST